jgi:hypothetical protein
LHCWPPAAAERAVPRKPSKYPIAKMPSTNGKIVSSSEETIMGMFGSCGAALAIRKNDWDVEQEFDFLIDTVRNASETRDKLAALRMLNGRVREIAEVNGLIIRQNARMVSHGPSGERLEASRSAARLLTSLKDHTNDGSEAIRARTIEPATD